MSIFDRMGDGCLTHLCESGARLHEKTVHEAGVPVSAQPAREPRARLDSRAASYLRFFRGAKLPAAERENGWMPKPV